MRQTDNELWWFAGAVQHYGYSGSVRLLLYPDGRVRTSFPRQPPSDPYHAFRPEDFR